MSLLRFREFRCFELHEFDTFIHAFSACSTLKFVYNESVNKVKHMMADMSLEIPDFLNENDFGYAYSNCILVLLSVYRTCP